jgi:hypothetical protein
MRPENRLTRRPLHRLPLKPQRFSGSLPRRDDADLDFVETAPSLGPPLPLDTCVYIDGLERNLPPGVETLLRARTLMHLSSMECAFSPATRRNA